MRAFTAEHQTEELCQQTSDRADVIVAGEVPVSSPPPVHRQVRAQAARCPEALAVSAPDGDLTYSELDRRSDVLARGLRDLGVGPDALVCLCVERSAALVVGALAILKAGGAFVALDPHLPDSRIQLMVDDSRAAVLVTRRAMAQRVRHDGHVLAVDDVALQLPGDLSAPDDAGETLENLAYIIYTSGSTGTPRGVMVEHRNLINLVSWHRRAFALDAGDRCTLVASPGFDAIVWEMWPALTAGASLHVPTDDALLDPAGLRDWLVSQRITVGFLPTPMAEAVLSLEWPAGTELRCLLTGGDALHKHPREDLPFALVNNYGPTEATVVTTSGVVEPCATPRSAPSLGRAIDNVRVEIVDEDLHPVEPGAPGELIIAGAGVARGYLNSPELTSTRFPTDPAADDPGARRFRSGDLVRQAGDESLEFLGRLDDQVKIRGNRVELGEIAANINAHPGVRSSVVVVSEPQPGAKQLVAYIVPGGGAAPDASELGEHLATRLPEHMMPSAYVWMDALPLTPSGKVDRAALPPPPADAPAVVNEPSTELERALADIVAPLLGFDAIDVDDNFFMLGGHSLLGAQLIARIGERFGVEMPLRTLFEHPTVAGMSVEVERLLVSELEAMSDEEADRAARSLASSPVSHGDIEQRSA